MRLILFLGLISITGALITQIFWLRKAMLVKESNFDQSVLLALRRVSERFDYSSTNTITPIDVVNKVSPRQFKLNINDKVDVNLLDFYLRTELSYPSLDIDFIYTVHDMNTDSAVFRQEVALSEETRLYQVYSDLPNFKTGSYYVMVNFPSRSEYIGIKMTIWIFSSVVLLIAVFFFGYTVLVILRQRRLVESQKDFINNMAHELKTPLATITISAETLSNPEILDQPERLQVYTTIIKNETERLRNQVDKLLQMSKMERDKIELHLEELDLHELLKEVIPNFSLKLEDGHGMLSYHLNAAHHLIKADKIHLTNIIYNLLDNAVKYSGDGPVIELLTRNEEGNLYFSVRDHGIGIPRDYQEKIFDKFYRVPTGNVHDVKGFGLGLHYLKMVVNAHKWNLELESEEGKGSMFTIVMPYEVKATMQANKEEVVAQ